MAHLTLKKNKSNFLKFIVKHFILICFSFFISKPAFAEADAADTYIILVKQKELAEDIYEKIIQEQPEKRFSIFSELAKSSIDPSSNNKSGSIGYVMKGQFPLNVENEIFSLPSDGYSKPIKTEFGWLILHVKDKRSDAIKNYCMASLNNYIQRAPFFERAMLEHSNIPTSSDNFSTIIKTILTGDWDGPFILDERDTVFFSKKLVNEMQLFEVVMHTELLEPQYAGLLDVEACYRSTQLKIRVDCESKKIAYMDEKRFEGRGAVGRVVREISPGTTDTSYIVADENSLGWFAQNYACSSQ